MPTPHTAGTLGSFENKPVPEFEAGDRSYLGAAQQAQQAHAQEEPFSKITFSRRDLPARMPAKSQVKYSYWPSRMTPDDAAATYAEIRGKRAEAGYATDEYAAAWRQWYNWQQQQQDQQQQHVKNANKHLANAYYHQTNAAGSSVSYVYIHTHTHTHRYLIRTHIGILYTHTHTHTTDLLYLLYI